MEMKANFIVQRFRNTGPVLNADIRKIYMPDITFPHILSLAATATKSEKRVLPEFVNTHLKAEPVINTRILSDGDRAFALEFHFPHFALRNTTNLLWEDMRQGGQQPPLRSFIDITELRGDLESSASDSIDIIYQSVTSCLITGHFSRRWSAYMFTDTYFVSHETENPQEESIKRWTEEREDDGKPDPFVLGFSLTERPLLNARDYFIDVFAKRLQRVYQESDHLVSHIERSVDRYLEMVPPNESPRKTSSRIFKDDAETIQVAQDSIRYWKEAWNWLTKTASTIDKILNTLCSLTEELETSIPRLWDMFCDSQLGRGTPYDRPEIRRGRFRQIEDLFTKLRRLLGRLSRTRERVAIQTRQVETAIGFDSGVIEQALASSQYKAAKNMKQATVIALAITPVTLISSLLSTQIGYIPIDPSPGILVAAVCVAELAIWLFWRYGDNVTAWFRNDFLGLPKKEHAD
ncbi:CorA-like Mg2+ transporter protein [Microdochium nivale]|nr:CorA-like Mg2+ transporter protein [Microdochium nivale]